MAVIEITTQIGCSVNCAYCPQKVLIPAYKKLGGARTMTLDLLKVYLESVPIEIEIGFTGMSEPWLNSECTSMVEYVYQKGYKIFIDTTLVGMSMQDIDRLSKLHFQYFAVHLPTENKYENITVDDKYLELLEQIKSRRIPAEKYYFHYYGGGLHHKINVPKARQLTIYPRAGNVDFGGIKTRKNRGRIACKRNQKQFHLLPNGSLVLCSMDYGLKHVLGNLGQKTYEDILSDVEFKRVNDSLNNEKIDSLCRYCQMYKVDQDWVAKLYNQQLPKILKRIFKR